MFERVINGIIGCLCERIGNRKFADVLNTKLSARRESKSRRKISGGNLLRADRSLQVVICLPAAALASSTSGKVANP
jgi:hypothetical protein